jgi:hypothetical protein
MPASMQFTSSLGNFQFAGDEMPLLSRRIEYQRHGDQGYGNRKINCDLQGFFDRNNHFDIMQAYTSLINIIKANDAMFLYSTSSSAGSVKEIINKRVYLDGYADPADWKEYQGDYTLAFHYFEPADFSIADLGIAVSYQTTVGLYTFVQPPFWQASIKPNRTSWRAPRFTPSGKPISSEATITLTGQLTTAGGHPDLKAQVEDLRNAFQLDGTLNYGSWSNAVRVETIDIPQTFPRDYCEFSLALKYDLQDVYNFQSTRSFSRLHAFPKIKEYPWCGTRRIQTFFPSAQTVRYYISIQAASISAARSLLANEALALITPNGIEMEGGVEEWNDTDLSVTLTCTKFYDPPILNNLANT